MTRSADLPLPGTASRPSSFYYGWVTVALAALAMVGTLPGRTQGLGLITEPLMKDLQLDRVTYAEWNLWATLLGSLFALVTGRLLDQFGARTLLTVVALVLGGVVIAMSRTAGLTLMFGLLVLSRGFGQNALSVVSLTMPGHWFARRLSLAMAVYSIALSIGFMAAFPTLGALVTSHGWRSAWGALGWSLIFVLAPVGWLLTRPAPRDTDLATAGETAPSETANGNSLPSYTWGQALRSPLFWVFALSSSIYNLLASGIGLFNESILNERGFEAGTFYRSLVITAMTSLVGNFLGGWLATKWRLSHLMALAMGLLALALLGLPSLTAVWHVDLFSIVMGVAGGFVIVLFFTAWPKLFGRAHLGRIQGTAQMLTVVASAVGPLVLAKCHAWTGSYATIFYLLAGVVALLGVAAWRVRSPQPTTSVQSVQSS